MMDSFFAPMKPHIFTYSIQVGISDLDELNHVNNIVYLRYLQEAAIAHWYERAPQTIAEAFRWVVRQHQITYFQPAFLADELQVSTWIEEFKGVTCLRRYEIHRGSTRLVEASTTWISLDALTLRPKRMGEEILPHFQIQ